MAILAIKPAAPCAHDILALGEVMLRLDPDETRIHTARSFQVWEGGGEYNVARGLRRCFGRRAAVATAIVDNPVGRLLEDLILQGGVSMAYVRWVPFDGIGRRARNPLNFTERGHGVRPALGCSDRGHSAASQLQPGDIDWERIFGQDGIRWFHTGGIFAGLSESTPAVVLEALACARTHGTIISYDLNYRPSLWRDIGGQSRAIAVNRAIVEQVDVLIGNEEDFTTALGFEVADGDTGYARVDVEGYQRMIAQVTHAFPNLKVVASTLRVAKTATRNDWGAIAWADGTFAQAIMRTDLEILDRIGGGDSFAAGLIYALMEDKTLAEAVNYGAAHGALAMTTPGDTSMATLSEVERLLQGGTARVER